MCLQQATRHGSQFNDSVAKRDRKKDRKKERQKDEEREREGERKRDRKIHGGRERNIERER